MDVSRCCKRLIAGDHAMGGMAASLRSVIAWLFIALVALFLTQPAGGTASAFDRPVPWPAELGLSGELGF